MHCVLLPPLPPLPLPAAVGHCRGAVPMPVRGSTSKTTDKVHYRKRTQYNDAPQQKISLITPVPSAGCCRASSTSSLDQAAQAQLPEASLLGQLTLPHLVPVLGKRGAVHCMWAG